MSSRQAAGLPPLPATADPRQSAPVKTPPPETFVKNFPLPLNPGNASPARPPAPGITATNPGLSPTNFNNSKTPAGMQEHWLSLELKSRLIRAWKTIVIAGAALGLLLLVISWAIAAKTEHSGLRRRHVASIIGFILAFCTIVLEGIALRAPPYLILLYGLQLLAALSLAMNALSMGMNNLVVDLCAAHDPLLQTGSIHCSAHYLEFSGAQFVCGAMISIYVTTQQSIVVLVDRGILRGIGTRLSSG